MKHRTTLYLTQEPYDFLKVKNINISEVCNQAIIDKATEMGYYNVESEIERLRKKLKSLRHVLKFQKKHDHHLKSFKLHFRAYLENGNRDSMAIRNWLTGPGNREYSDIIGHPRDLSIEKIKELIAIVMTE